MSKFFRDAMGVKLKMTKSEAMAWDRAVNYVKGKMTIYGGSTIHGVKIDNLHVPGNILPDQKARMCLNATIHNLRTIPQDWYLWLAIYSGTKDEYTCSSELVTVTNVTSATLTDQLNMLISKRVHDFDADYNEEPTGYAWVASPLPLENVEEQEAIWIPHFADNYDITNVEKRKLLSDIWRIENNKKIEIDTSSLVVVE